MSQYARGLPLTRIRIAGARFLFSLLSPFLSSKKKRIVRGGLRYEVELSEGLDFSLFLLGQFQAHVIGTRFFHLNEDSTTLDIGANVGVFSLKLAQVCPKGVVHSFEPSDWGFRKLEENIKLNPEFAGRIVTNKCFVSNENLAEKTASVYARWPLIPNSGDQRHNIHRGVAEAATLTPTISIDSYVEHRRLPRIDFIKIDTDGHEWEVLRGAEKVIARDRPYIVFEIGGFLLEERGQRFEAFIDFFESRGYQLKDTKSGRAINLETYSKVVPHWSGIDILAIPPPPSRTPR